MSVFCGTLISILLQPFYNPVDLHLELACIQKITQKLISFYESFATTIEEDQILLKTASIRLYFAVILR
jgi:hypothetical protein